MDCLQEHANALQRFVYYRMPSQADAEDILQEVALAAIKAKDVPEGAQRQKAWLLGIARHKCQDYFRRQAKAPQALDDNLPVQNPCENPVRETIGALRPDHRQLLERAYFHGDSLAAIADAQGLAVGTVKSRLHSARAAFRTEYERGESPMKAFPKQMPAYEITPSALRSFAVDCEELGAWMFRPRENENAAFALYDLPGIDGHETGWLTNLTTIKYAGKTVVHGIEGLAFEARDEYFGEDAEVVRRWFAAQKTETHVRWIAEEHEEDGARKFTTFLDEDFLQRWGLGENNIGTPIHLPAETFVGRFHLRMLEQTHDTVCLRKRGGKEPRSFSERYFNAKGRTLLQREFWLPEALAERGYAVDGRAGTTEYEGQHYVHWYDGISAVAL